VSVWVVACPHGPPDAFRFLLYRMPRKQQNLSQNRPGRRRRLHDQRSRQKPRFLAAANGAGLRANFFAPINYGTPSKKSTSPVSSEYSAPTTNSPSVWINSSIT
jgi:hypothetical protein